MNFETALSFDTVNFASAVLNFSGFGSFASGGFVVYCCLNGFGGLLDLKFVGLSFEGLRFGGLYFDGLDFDVNSSVGTVDFASESPVGFLGSRSAVFYL